MTAVIGPWTVAACALSFAAAPFTVGCGTAAAGERGPTLVGSADFSAPDGRPVQVQVTVNGHPALMILDTANMGSLLFAPYVEPLGLNVKQVQQRNFSYAGKPLTQYARLTSFAIGSAKLGDPPVFILPDDHPPRMDANPLIGHLSMDLLGAYDFELDFANHKLRLYESKNRTGRVVYWTNRYSSVGLTRTVLGDPIFAVELDGKRVEAAISTNSPYSLLRADAAQRLYPLESSRDAESKDVPGMPHLASRTMVLTGIGLNQRALRVFLDPSAPDPSCQLTFQNTGAAYYSGVMCTGREAPLRLGLDVIRQLHLYVAMKAQVLYASEAAASN